MSSLKKFMIAVLANFCMLFAVNVFAQAQNEDKKAEAESSDQSTTTITTTTSVPGPVAPSTGTAPVLPGIPATPATPRRFPAQNRSRGQSIQAEQSIQAGQNFQAAMSKAEEEMQKAKMQFDKTLKDLELSRSPEAIQKAREELQKAMQKAQDEMNKAKAQFDKTTQEIHSIQVGPGGVQVDPFMGGGGGGFGGGMGGFGGGVSGSTGGFVGGGYGSRSGGGRVIMDNRNGQMIVSGPVSMTIISDPEAKELRDKEQNCTDNVNTLVERYNAIPATAPGDRAAIKTELEKAVGEQFAIRQEYRELQIKQLEKELARVRETIQKRNENREQIIKRHISQLLHEQDDTEF